MRFRIWNWEFGIFFLTFCIILFTAGSFANADNAVEITDVDNRTVAGDLLGLSNDKVTISATSISLNDIAGIVFPNTVSAPVSKPEPGDVFKITFAPTGQANGDVLYGTIAESGKEGFVFHNGAIGDIHINFEQVSFIERVGRNEIEPIKQAAREDVIVLNSGDTDSGVTMELTPASISIRSSLYQKDKTYKLKDIKTVSFFSLTAGERKKKSTKDLQLVVFLNDNSRLSGVLLPAPANESDIILSSGKISYHIPIDKISFIYIRNNRCVYLSDLDPIKVKEYVTAESPNNNPQSPIGNPQSAISDVPFLWHYQADRTIITAQPIMMQGKRYFKGLSAHANCELTYKLDGLYQRFFTVIGLDDSVLQEAIGGIKPSVRFRIYLDDKKAYESGIIKSDNQPTEISLDIKSANELRLEVDDAGDGYVLDRAVWGAARLIK